MLYKVYIPLHFKITLVYVCFFKPCSSQKKQQPSTFAQFCNATQCTIGEPNNYSPSLLSFYFVTTPSPITAIITLSTNSANYRFALFWHKHTISFFLVRV